MKKLLEKLKEALLQGQPARTMEPAQPMEQSGSESLAPEPDSAATVLDNLRTMITTVTSSVEQQDLEHIDAALALLAEVREENGRVERFQREHHEYLLESDPEDVDAEFDDYITALAFVFSRIGAPASTHEIDELAAQSSRVIPDSLCQFYRSVGGVKASFALGSLSMFIATPSKRLNDQQPLRPGLGLYDQVLNSWGGVRDDLSVEQGFDADLLEDLNRTLCVGWFGDGYCEAHVYIIETSPDKYGLYYWHQDDALDLPDFENINSMPLFELLAAALGVYRQELAAADYDIEEVEFDLGVLTSSLCKVSG